LSDICDVKSRLDLIKALSQKADFSKFNDAINRIIRIIKDASTTQIDEKLLVVEAEKTLYKEASVIDEKALTYEALADKLSALEPVISKFFEDVLVMDKDEAIKNNRIMLLTSIKSKFAVLADFSKIVL
jgi:glycyl-tRNA synthetase beta chain